MNTSLETAELIEKLNLSSAETESIVRQVLMLEDENLDLKKQLRRWHKLKAYVFFPLRLWELFSSFLFTVVPKLKFWKNPPRQTLPLSEEINQFEKALTRGKGVMLVWAPPHSYLWKRDFPTQLFGLDSFFISMDEGGKQHQVQMITPQVHSRIEHVIGECLDVEFSLSQSDLIQLLHSKLDNQ